MHLEIKPTGTFLAAPFVMRLPATDSAREPDLQIILDGNPGTLHDTYMEGPADICIEVVSPESISRDHGTKFEEYEKGGVGEYWIIDPVHRECRFYHLGNDGVYVPHSEDADGYHTTPRLPQFRLHVPTLWAEKLPGPTQIAQTVRAMLK